MYEDVVFDDSPEPSRLERQQAAESYVLETMEEPTTDKRTKRVPVTVMSMGATMQGISNYDLQRAIRSLEVELGQDGFYRNGEQTIYRCESENPK